MTKNDEKVMTQSCVTKWWHIGLTHTKYTNLFYKLMTQIDDTKWSKMMTQSNGRH